MNLNAAPEASLQIFPPNNGGGGANRGYQTLGNQPGMVLKI